MVMTMGVEANQSSEQVLGEQLQSARKAAGLTQQQLCQKANLSYSTLAKIERGAIKSPSIFTIQSIASALGVSLNELLGVASPVAADSKKASKSGVRFVYFDINGVLVRFYHRAFAQLAQDSGQPADVIETVFWHYNDAVCRGDMPIEEFNAVLAEKFGLKDLDWRTYYIDAIEPISEMHDLLTWVSQHYYVGLLSNIMPGLIETMMQNGLLPTLPYTAVIDSSVVRAIKPEQQIYEIAQQQAAHDSEEILLIDDSRANLMAAERMGWRVIWFDDYRPEESTRHIREALEPEL